MFIFLTKPPQLISLINTFQILPLSNQIIMKLFFINLATFLFFIYFQASQTNATTITDLDSSDYSGFLSQTNNWASTGVYSTKVSSCWGYYIMGGYDVLTSPTGYFSRTFSGLDTHNTVYLSIRVFQIDSWDSNEGFALYLDGPTIQGWTFSKPAGWTAYACGGSWAEDPPVMMYVTMPHTSSSFTLRLIAVFDQDSTDESVGFRDLTITTAYLGSPPTSISYCGVTTGMPLDYSWCTCTSHQYMEYSQSGICIECSTNCQTCSGSSTTCTTCYPGWYMVGTTCYPTCTYPLYSSVDSTTGVTYCNTPCPNEYAYWDGSCGSTCGYTNAYDTYASIYAETESTFAKCMYPCGTTQFLYWNNSCLSSCPDPLTTDVYKSRNFCAYSCADTEYLYWNLSCLSTCPSPLSPEVQGTYLQKNFCWYACMPWQWLYWDQTCQENCVPPLWPEIQGTTTTRQFCWYPCTSEAKFLYWNGTCLTECPEPLSTRYENGQWFCDYPCSSTQYLYWNGSCISTCVSPLLSKIEGSPARKFCYYPCQVDEFAYWDNTCQSSCDFPLVPNPEGDPTRQFCWYLCPTNQYLYWNGSCISECNFPLSSRVTDDRNFCDYPCQENEYLFWNGSCLATCPYSLSVRVEGVYMKRNFCDFLCDPSQYLYWNGSCLDTCDFPLSTRNEGSAAYPRKFCDYPCVGNQYLYWNGTCKTTCALPLIIRIDIDKGFCDYLCAATDIIYWDGSCSSTCDSPLVSYSAGTPSRNYCKFPCENEQFLYPNGTCFNTCSFPLTSSVLKSRLFCHYPCSSTQFLYWNGSCLDSCSFPLSTRIENSWQYCDYPCLTSEYLYWNGSCLASCPFPLTPRVTANNLYCDFSCTTNTDYLYWNGTCDSDCPFPLQATQQGSVLTINYCASPCPTQYLYWNGSCISQCSFPLSTRVNNGTYFCDYPCLYTEFLYWNASCSASCIFPLSTRIDAGNNYCDKPCKYDEEYAYWNGTCSPLCDSPLQTRNESSMLYCDYPCDPSDYLFFTGICITNCTIPHQTKIEGETMLRNFCTQNCTSDEYLYWNGSCREVCHSPRRTIYNNSIRYCEKPCEESDYYYQETLERCQATCDYPNYSFFNVDYLACKTPSYWALAESYTYFDMFLHAPLKDNTLTVVDLVKMMQYVRYIDIDMPPRLERLASSKGRPLLSIRSGITMWSGLLNQFSEQTLPDAYHRLHVHSSFLVNYWEDLSMIMIGIVLALVFLCFERLVHAFGFQKAEVILRTLRVLIKWNFVIMMIAINIDDVVLYSALQITSWDSDDSSSTVSFILCIITIAAMLLFFGAICYLSASWQSRAQNSINSIDKYRENHHHQTPTTFTEESYQSLFRGFRENSLGAQFFFPTYTLRIAIPMLIAVAAESIPILNTVMQFTFSCGVLGFIVYVKPFTKRINQIQLVLFETIILIMNFLMVIITLISINDKENYKVAIFLGDLVILGNDCINIMSIVFMIIKLHSEIKQIREYQTRKIVQGDEVIGLWVQLLYIPLQQANMGFEEMAAYPTSITQPPPKPRMSLEESEISLKKNTPFTERSPTETNQESLFQENMRTEVSFCHEESDIEHKSPPLISQNPQGGRPLKNKQANKTFSSQKPPILLHEIGASPRYFPSFQVEPLAFDRNTTVNNFSISDEMNNFPSSPDTSPERSSKKQISFKDGQLKMVKGGSGKLEETLDLGDDNALFDKIKDNLAALNQEMSEKKKTTHPYLKKNAGINRKKYQANH